MFNHEDLQIFGHKYMSSFHPLQAVGRGSGENLNYFNKIILFSAFRVNFKPVVASFVFLRKQMEFIFKTSGKHRTFNQCCLNVGPLFAKLTQY